METITRDLIYFWAMIGLKVKNIFYSDIALFGKTSELYKYKPFLEK